MICKTLIKRKFIEIIQVLVIEIFEFISYVNVIGHPGKQTKIKAPVKVYQTRCRCVTIRPGRRQNILLAGKDGFVHFVAKSESHVPIVKIRWASS
jgi:hypothetical protein